MENVYTNVLYIKQISLPTMNVKNTSERLYEGLTCATIITPCHKKQVNNTELSKYLWKLKEENVDCNLQWSIKAYASSYKCGTRKYDLCLTKKMIIARSDSKKLLNKRTELVSKCRQRSKFLLSNIK